MKYLLVLLLLSGCSSPDYVEIAEQKNHCKKVRAELDEIERAFWATMKSLNIGYVKVVKYGHRIEYLDEAPAMQYLRLAGAYTVEKLQKDYQNNHCDSYL